MSAIDREGRTIWIVDAHRDAAARIPLNFHMSGNQDEDKPWSGTEINGQAIAVIDADGRVSYTDVSAGRDLGGDEGDDA